ncbi:MULTISPECIES: hypothetical protein [unclassified Aliiroseovarius]|uniref:hypothetical protein n=1 Tax=unclassified Aliiroseovarius TaxID=2623558 RepID=UPI00156A1F79|nr:MULTISPECIES: hypothetical protein [unclassified Aliiroseovarius]
MDSETIGGATVAADVLVKHRLQIGFWPIYNRTPLQRHMNQSTEFWIYVGGRHSYRQSFFARFWIINTVSWRPLDILDPEDILTSSPTSALKIKEHEVFHNPIYVRPIVNDLEIFSKNPSKWWVFLQGGARRLSEKDRAKLLNMAN